MNVLLALFSLEMAADGWTTAQTLRFGGYETIPYLAWLMLKIGKVPALLIAKVVPIAAVWYAIYVGQMPWQLLAGLEVLYAWVIWHNWQVLSKQKGT